MHRKTNTGEEAHLREMRIRMTLQFLFSSESASQATSCDDDEAWGADLGTLLGGRRGTGSSFRTDIGPSPGALPSHRPSSVPPSQLFTWEIGDA